VKWRLLIILLLLAFLLSSCGGKQDPLSVGELKSLFEQEAQSFNISLDLEDFDVQMVGSFDKPGVLGRCWFRGEGLMRGFLIELLTSPWEKGDAEYRESIFFHEGGHCFLGQGHRSNSLMKPALIDDYFARRDFYIPELFSHGWNLFAAVTSDGSYEDDGVHYIDITRDHSCQYH